MRLDKGKIIVEITLGNEAMSRPTHVCDLLISIANEIGALRYFPGHDPGEYSDLKIRTSFMDENGNTVAHWRKEEG